MGADMGDDTILLNDAFIERLKESKYVKSVDYVLQAFAASKYHNTQTDQFKEMGMDPFEVQTDYIDSKEVKYKIPTIYVYSLDSVEKNSDFVTNKVKLKEGVYPYESKEENPVLVSQNF